MAAQKFGVALVATCPSGDASGRIDAGLARDARDQTGADGRAIWVSTLPPYVQAVPTTRSDHAGGTCKNDSAARIAVVASSLN
jgi:hypothetical protein